MLVRVGKHRKNLKNQNNTGKNRRVIDNVGETLRKIIDTSIFLGYFKTTAHYYKVFSI